MTEGICSKFQSAPKFAAFESHQALRASVPTPIGPSGHFPLIGGIGPLCPRGALDCADSHWISVYCSCLLQPLRRCAPAPLSWEPRGVRNFELLQISRERSKKTEAVFWSVQGGPGGEIEISPGSFSFGEAKERVVPQLLISICVLNLTNTSLTAKQYSFQVYLNGMERYRQVCRIHRIICAWLHSSSAIFSSMQRCVPAFSASASYASCAACSSE